MKRLFGTDGIRAVAGLPPLDPATVRTFGAALAEVLRLATGHPPRVAVGRDTRESGPWLREAVAAGLAARVGSAADAGVITTPGLSYAVRAGLFDAGVMISASHNPLEDNGLKVFGRDGSKLPDDLEHEIEARILDHGIEDPGDHGRRAAEDGSLVAPLRGFPGEGAAEFRPAFYSIINISSGATPDTGMRMAPYIASKLAVEGLTRAAALEYSRQGIRINTLLFGVFETEKAQQFHAAMPAFLEKNMAKHHVGRLGDPEHDAGEAAAS